MTDTHSNLPTKDYTPTGNQQQQAVPKPIAAPDDEKMDSQGNQAIKEALDDLHPKDMVRNLDPTKADEHPADASEAPPFAGYATGKVPDTAKGADSE